MNLLKGLDDSLLMLVLLVITIVMIITLGMLILIAVLIGFSEIILFDLKIRRLEKAGVLIPNQVYLDKDKNSKKYVLKKKRSFDMREYLQTIVNLNDSEFTENSKIDLDNYDVPKDKKTISKP